MLTAVFAVATMELSPYDKGGCWSGTAIVKDDVLYLFYASLYTPVGSDEKLQCVSMAYSADGIHFEKYAGNPIIGHYPPESGRDFRDPAVAYIDGKYYCVMATGNPELKVNRLLIYESENPFDWKLGEVMIEWENSRFTECPSFISAENGKCLLTASLCTFDHHYFSALRIFYGAV